MVRDFPESISGAHLNSELNEIYDQSESIKWATLKGVMRCADSIKCENS